MSSSTLNVHEDYEKRDDLEKSPPEFVKDVEGLEIIQRTPTTLLAHITDLDKGLIAWESKKDPENPLLVSLQLYYVFAVADRMDRHWPAKKRRINMTIISLITFLRYEL